MKIRMLKTLGGEFPAAGETCTKADRVAQRLIQGGYAESAESPAPAPKKADS